MALANAVFAAALSAAAPQPLLIDQGRADRVPVPDLPQQQGQPVHHIDQATPAKVDATGNGRPIKGIRFVGAQVPGPVADAAREFVNRPANRHVLEQLAAAMSAAYGKSDVALYTVAIPDQDLSHGTVIVQVAQGFIEDIVYPGGASPQMRRLAARLRAIRPLTRTMLERQLSLMSDIAGATVKAQMLRGRQAGGVVLSLTITRKHIDGTLGYDNSQSPLLGQGEFSGELSGNSLLRDGDETKLSVLAARDLHSFVYTGLTHSTPLGSSGLKLNLTGAYLRTNVDSLDLHGNAVAAGFSLSYPLIRSYHRNLTISGGIDGVNSDSALYGAVLSSDHIRASRFAAGYSMAGSKTVFTAGATLSKGLGLLDDRGTPGQSDPRFTKVNATAGYNRAFGKHLILRLKGEGQYSGNALPATERLAVGGADYGRAFETAGLTGDSGFAGSLEMAVRPSLGKRLTGTEVYGFIDHAKIYTNDRLGYPATRYDIGSAGGGIRLAYTTLASISVEGAKAIQDPFNGALGDWRVNVSWKLNIPHKWL